MPKPPRLPTLDELRQRPVKFSFSVLGAAIVVLMMLLHRTTVAVVVLIIVEAVIWIGLAASLLRDRRAGRH